MNENSLRDIGTTLKTQIIILGGFIILIWLVEVVDWVIFQSSLDLYGIQPRTVSGLWGVLWAPVLHHGFGHVMANTVPFLVLGWFVLLQGMRPCVVVTAVAWIVSGLGTWLIAPANTIHVGASSLVFGYFGYLLLRAYFERSFSAILWSLFVIMLYGGLIWGVFPGRIGISWQGHLFGFIGGGLAAYWLAKIESDTIVITYNPNE